MTADASAAPSLVAVIGAFGLAPAEVQAFDPAHPRIDAQRALLVLAAQREDAARVVAGRYPGDHPVRSLAGGRVEETTAGAFASEATGAGVDAWLVAPLAPEHDARSLAGLRGIMARLYSPDGCPWDYEQTHESLRSSVIEEAYEAAEAIDRGDLDGLREELGDLLLQVFFHAAIAEASGAFDLDDVAEAITRKMVRRHPHVFGDGERGSTAEEQWRRWDAIKAAERAEAGKRGEDDSPFASLPLALPALQRAQSVLGRAARAGIGDAPTADDALASLAEAAQALAGAPESERGERLGALLWAAALYARAADVDAEAALRQRTARFVAEAGADRAP